MQTRMYLKTIAVAFCFFLTGCGGGGDLNSNNSSDATHQSLAATVDVAIAETAKQINDSSGVLIVQTSDGTLAVSKALGINSGDVVIYNGQGFKFGSELGADPITGRQKFTQEKPRLDELYKKIELDGDFEILDANAASASNRVQPQSWGIKDYGCIFSNSILGSYVGKKCTLSLKDSEYKLPTIRGSYEAGVKATFKKFDFISNTGSGIISLAAAGTAAIELNAGVGVGSLASDAANEACSSSLAMKGYASNGRILLAAPSIPLGVTGTELIFPICISAGASANMAGEILSLAPNVRIDILVGDGKPPRPAAPPTAGSINPASDAAIWNLNPIDTSVAKLKVSAKGELAAEMSLELSAARLLYLGYMSRLTGNASLSAEASPAIVSASSALSTLKASPQFCAKLDLAGNYQLSAFAAIPAFSLLGDIDASGKKVISEVQLAARQDKFGLCGKSTSETSLTTDSNPSLAGVPFKVNVKVSAKPRPNEIPYDSFPSGEVEVIDLTTGVVFCKISLDGLGAGACAGKIATIGKHKLVSKYSGNGYYFESDSLEYSQEVNGEFAFEVAEINPNIFSASAPQRIEYCSPFDYTTSDRISYSGDVCTTNKDARIRCIGAGCGGGRFYVAIRTSRATFYTKCYSGPCVNDEYVQDAYGITPERTIFYEEGSVWWYPMSDAAWIKAWPSFSGISNPWSYYKLKSIANLDNAALLLLNGGKLDIEYNIYDKQKKTYIIKTLTVTSP